MPSFKKEKPTTDYLIPYFLTLTMFVFRIHPSFRPSRSQYTHKFDLKLLVLQVFNDLALLDLAAGVGF